MIVFCKVSTCLNQYGVKEVFIKVKSIKILEPNLKSVNCAIHSFLLAAPIWACQENYQKAVPVCRFQMAHCALLYKAYDPYVRAPMKIRPAEKSDAREISQVYVQTWQDTYLGLVPFGYLHGMSSISLSKDFEHHLINGHDINYVAQDKGQIIGFINGGDERRGDCIYCGEIYALYVLKNYQRQGIGTGLVAALISELNAYGIYSMMVRVLSHNPYRNFYEKINGVFLHKKRKRFAGELLDISTYGWIDTSLVSPPAC